MIKKIPINDELEIVFSNNECGYQDVLDDFQNASFINILTYNISTRDSRLLELIDSLQQDINIKIITNIPNRFATYYSDDARKRAKRNIENYMDNLDPGSFNVDISSFFNFDNHSKIIMTDNFAYIGSENFSAESTNNFECGIIIKSPRIIQEVDKEIFSIIEHNSIQYHGSDVTRLKVLFANVYSKLKVLQDSIHCGFYNVHEERGHETEYYDSNKADISVIHLEELEALTFEIEEIVGDFEDDENFCDLMTNLSEDNVFKIRELIEEGSQIYKVAQFDEMDYMDDYLQEHAMEAYDEHLDKYAQEASDSANEVLESLADEAESDVIDLEDRLLNLLKELELVLDNLTERDNNSVKINNT